MESSRIRPAAVAFVVLLSACGWLTGPDSEAETRDGDYVLQVAAERSTWSSDEPIQVAASLSYVGPLATKTISSSGTGPIAFGVKEIGGTRWMEAGWNLDCAPHEIGRQAPILRPYAKSGGFPPEDPNAAFYRAFFADPEFRLPPGQWRVTAVAHFLTEAGCAGDSVELRASVTLTVE